jgi:hypothetical protein
MMKTAISEAINAYSIAVATFWLERKALSDLIIPNPFDKGADPRGALTRPSRTVPRGPFPQINIRCGISIRRRVFVAVVMEELTRTAEINACWPETERLRTTDEASVGPQDEVPVIQHPRGRTAWKARRGIGIQRGLHQRDDRATRACDATFSLKPASPQDLTRQNKPYAKRR